jgi:hypothetical protein
MKLTGFDPTFDDRAWTADWMPVPVAQIPPGHHPSGYRVERQRVDQIMIFDRAFYLDPPFDCRLLFDSEGRLWMSDTPQERIMMHNNGKQSTGHVLIGGLGLGLYPQYAVPEASGSATRFTVIEHSPIVKDLVEPVLHGVLERPFEVQIGDVEDYLAGPVTTRYDTIFLDTWETLDATHLPKINRMRDLARLHLAPEGQILLWGYRWMVDLFLDACRQLLDIDPDQREAALAASVDAQASALLAPVVDHFAGQMGDESALSWCENYIITAV